MKQLSNYKRSKEAINPGTALRPPIASEMCWSQVVAVTITARIRTHFFVIKNSSEE